MLHRIREYMHNRYGVLPFAQAQPALESWLESPLGRSLLEEEQRYLDDALGCLFGYHLMELSVSRRLELSGTSRIQHRFALGPSNLNGTAIIPREGQERGPADRIAALSEIDSLPLASEAIDVAVLHHVLEFAERPHKLLREASRVLIPRGHVVIMGFNPVSHFGLCKPFARYLLRRPHWRYHTLRLGRVLDWLRLLDFEPVTVTQGFYRPPLQHSGIMRRLMCLERWGEKTPGALGGFYLIVARKDVAAMTLIKPSWKAFNPIADLVGHKPAPRMIDPLVKLNRALEK